MRTNGNDWPAGDLIDHGPLLDREAASEFLNVSPRTVYRLVRAGELPAYKVGRQIRIAQVALENYLLAQPLPVYRETES